MKYKPGSFSKNFAWHGTGLRKLHSVIRVGFNNRLAPVDRNQFREASGLGSPLSLIPINFFLHNRAGQLSVDELVFQAIKRPYSFRFSLLALFALHANRAGSGKSVVERPAMWANEYVRESLWHKGSWRSSALQHAKLDQFINDRMNAQKDVRIKCRNNYRHLFELCELWPTSLKFIDTLTEQWIALAFFLAWDRHLLDGGQGDKDSLVAIVDSDELYKLLGVTRKLAVQQAESYADLYVSVGCQDRFREVKNMLFPGLTAIKPEIPEESGLEWLDQEELDVAVRRRWAEREEQDRDRKKAAALRQRYGNICQFCGLKLQVAKDCHYSEAAHIKGLGKPHDGPDKVSNMLVLCPNHHIQFDRGILSLHKVGTTYRIRSKVAGDPLHNKPIYLCHEIDDACVRYHYTWSASREI
ncbi:MAG: HNH endonuclease [Rhodobacteraceae bacterium]|nr:HNH endonuclease [Paracoccaceae bacterium]